MCFGLRAYAVRLEALRALDRAMRLYGPGGGDAEGGGEIPLSRFMVVLGSLFSVVHGLWFMGLGFRGLGLGCRVQDFQSIGSLWV